MVLAECRTISDEELVTRIRNGEAPLYEMLMRRYNQRLFRVIRSVVASDSEAEDVLQEAWVRAYVHLNDLQQRLGPAVTATYCFLGARCDAIVARVLERIAG